MTESCPPLLAGDPTSATRNAPCNTNETRRPTSLVHIGACPDGVLRPVGSGCRRLRNAASSSQSMADLRRRRNLGTCILHSRRIVLLDGVSNRRHFEAKARSIALHIRARCRDACLAPRRASNNRGSAQGRANHRPLQPSVPSFVYTREMGFRVGGYRAETANFDGICADNRQPACSRRRFLHR